MKIYGKGKGPLVLQAAENMRKRKGLTLGHIRIIALNENKPLFFKGLLAPKILDATLNIPHARARCQAKKHPRIRIYFLLGCIFFLQNPARLLKQIIGRADKPGESPTGH
jgi:hypothetical protein